MAALSRIVSKREGYAALARAVLKQAYVDGVEIEAPWKQALKELGSGCEFSNNYAIDKQYTKE